MPKLKLTTTEFDYLLKFLPAELRKTLENGMKSTSMSVIVDISEDAASDIRDAAGVQLQKSGFGHNYELNAGGKILEDIIDALYIP